ncbi:MAG TPA: VOC family protein [Methylomirabilota bacterium]|jgi:PhnB protein|nr:VOC family protein [Methylomirabilota bacterium]
MRVNPYLLFNGRCQEAFTFYAECLGGKIEAMLPHAGTPAEGHVPPEWREKIMHARLSLGEDVIMGSDAPPGHFESPKGFSVTIQLTDPAEADRIFQRLSDGATVTMPIQQTFWATRFGMLVDRFGTPWMVNCQPAG